MSTPSLRRLSKKLLKTRNKVEDLVYMIKDKVSEEAAFRCTFAEKMNTLKMDFVDQIALVSNELNTKIAAKQTNVEQINYIMKVLDNKIDKQTFALENSKTKDKILALKSDLTSIVNSIRNETKFKLDKKVDASQFEQTMAHVDETHSQFRQAIADSKNGKIDELEERIDVIKSWIKEFEGEDLDSDSNSDFSYNDSFSETTGNYMNQNTIKKKDSNSGVSKIGFGRGTTMKRKRMNTTTKASYVELANIEEISPIADYKKKYVKPSPQPLNKAFIKSKPGSPEHKMSRSPFFPQRQTNKQSVEMCINTQNMEPITEIKSNKSIIHDKII